jgi:hypothetical protein
VIQSYRPHALSVAIQLFVPAIKTGLAEVSGRKLRADADHGWSSEIGQSVEIEELPGDHFTMMVGDSAALLAGALARHLDTSNARDARIIEPASR